MNQKSSPTVPRVLFSLFILLALIGSFTIEASARGKKPRKASARKAARGGKVSKRERQQQARSGRRGGRHLSRKSCGQTGNAKLGNRPHI